MCKRQSSKLEKLSIDLGKSKLIDMRDCESAPYKEIFEEMAEITRDSQPRWLLPVLKMTGQYRPYLFQPLRTRRWELPWAILNADLEPGMRVLDAGCGGSPLLIFLARRGLRCWGIDPGRGHEGIGDIGVYRFVRRRLLEAAGINLMEGFYDLSKRLEAPVVYQQQSIMKMSFEDGFFDRVFCLSVIEHIPMTEWRACTEQLLRVVSPGGRLLITMDMPARDVHRYEKVIEYTGAKAEGSISHSVPADIRHPDWAFETVGIVVTKERA